MGTQSIVLARHGPAVVVWDQRIASREFAGFLDRVRESGVRAHPGPDAKTRRLAEQVGVLVCSNLRRSIQSAEILAPGRSVVNDSAFREAEVPAAFSAPLSWLSLRASTWAVVARILWYAHCCRDNEPIEEARMRARRAAQVLADLANDRQSVFLVGHGCMNSLIATELRRQGWEGPRFPSVRHWGTTTYLRGV